MKKRKMYSIALLFFLMYTFLISKTIASPTTIEYMNAITACGVGAKSTVSNETQGTIRRQIDGDVASGRAVDEIIPKIADTMLAEISRSHSHELYDSYIVCLKNLLDHDSSSLNDLKSSIDQSLFYLKQNSEEQNNIIRKVEIIDTIIIQIQKRKSDEIAIKALNGDSLTHKVLDFLSTGQTDEAIRLLQQQADADVEAGGARTQLGIAEYNQISAILLNRDPQRAKAAALNALQINPQDPEAMFLTFLVSMLSENLQDAKEYSYVLEHKFSDVSLEGQLLKIFSEVFNALQNGDLESLEKSLNGEKIQIKNKGFGLSSIENDVISTFLSKSLCTLSNNFNEIRKLCMDAFSGYTNLEKKIRRPGLFTVPIAEIRLKLGKLDWETGHLTEAMEEISQAEGSLIKLVGEEPNASLALARLLDVYSLSFEILRKQRPINPSQLAALADRAQQEIAHVEELGKLGTVIGISVTKLEQSLGFYNEDLHNFEAARICYLNAINTFDKSMDVSASLGEIAHTELFIDVIRMNIALKQTKSVEINLHSAIMIFSHFEKVTNQESLLDDLVKAIIIYIDFVDARKNIDVAIDFNGLESNINTVTCQIIYGNSTLAHISEFYNKYQTYEQKQGNLNAAKVAGLHWLNILLQLKQTSAKDRNDTAIAMQYARLGDLWLDPHIYNEPQAVQCYSLAAILARAVWANHPNRSSKRALDILFMVDERIAEITLLRQHHLDTSSRVRMKSDFFLAKNYARLTDEALGIERLEQEWFFKLLQYSQYSDAAKVGAIGVADSGGLIGHIEGRFIGSYMISLWDSAFSLYYEAMENSIKSENYLQKAINSMKNGNSAFSNGSLVWNDRLKLLYRFAVHVAMDRDCTVFNCTPALQDAWDEELADSQDFRDENTDNNVHHKYWSAMFFKNKKPISWIYYSKTSLSQNSLFYLWDELKVLENKMTIKMLSDFLFYKN